MQKVSVEQALAHLTSDLPSMCKGTKKLSWILAIFLSIFLQASLEKLLIEAESNAEDVAPFSNKESSSVVSESKEKHNSRSNNAIKFKGLT